MLSLLTLSIWPADCPLCSVAAIHGDMDQHTRMTTLHDFKAGEWHLMPAQELRCTSTGVR